MKVNIFFKTRAPVLIKKRIKLFKHVIVKVLGKEKGEINLIFTDGREIKELNRIYLGKDELTDVIAFKYEGLSYSKLKNEKPFGDIFVCVDSAKLQSKQMGHSLIKELLILTAHGALHLSGMDDLTKKQKEAMEIAAAKILKKIGG